MNPLPGILIGAGVLYLAFRPKTAAAATPAAPGRATASGGTAAAFGPGPVNPASFDVWDSTSRARLKGLHPDVALRAERLLRDAYNRGIRLRITFGLRTYAEQEALHAQGRLSLAQVNELRRKAGLYLLKSQAENSQVTNARPGTSWHNFGLAFDVVEIKDGKALWENPRWPLIGSMGKAQGLKWGGDWTKFKDLPHFEYNPGGLSLAEFRQRYEANGLAWIAG